MNPGSWPRRPGQSLLCWLEIVGAWPGVSQREEEVWRKEVRKRRTVGKQGRELGFCEVKMVSAAVSAEAVEYITILQLERRLEGPKVVAAAAAAEGEPALDSVWQCFLQVLIQVGEL